VSFTDDATTTWRMLLTALLHAGDEVKQESAGADFRGRTNKELLSYRTLWDMERPVIACPHRKLGYRFMLAEAAWILSGDNRLNQVAPYSKHISRFSDDGRTLSGAYGPPFVEQAGYIARTLAADRASRQAVVTIWRPRPGPSNDIPCTVALQWIIRKSTSSQEDLLHCVATMRSSDAWTGVPYDVFAFSMMSAYVAIALREHLKHEWKRLGMRSSDRERLISRLKLGTLFLTAGSAHLYKQDWEDASECCTRTDRLFVARSFNLDAFPDTNALVAHLKQLADERHTVSDAVQLSELTEVKR